MGLYARGVQVDIPGISEHLQPAVNAWQTAEIEIYDPDIDGGEYDVWQNQVVGRAPHIFWQGQARMQPLRWPTMVTGKAEQSAYRAMRFQIPLTAVFNPPGVIIREGFRIKVLDGGNFPDVTNAIFVVTSATNSSQAFNRTIETIMDLGVDLGNP